MSDTGPYRESARFPGPGDLVAQLEIAEQCRDRVLDSRRRLQEAKAASKKASFSHRAALKSLDAANLRLRELKSGRGSTLAKAAGVTLYEFWLDIPQYSGPVRGSTAEVTQHGDVHQVSDVTGTTKSGLGGAIVGGLLLGPVGAVVGLAATRKTDVTTKIRTVDTRQFELRISGPGFAWSTIAGPDSAPAFRNLRDLINARGSTREELSFVTDAHVNFVASQELAAVNAEDAYRAASALAEQHQRFRDIEWEKYANLRLPVLLDGRARWARSGSFARSAMVFVGPLFLVAWTVSLLFARITHQTDLSSQASVAGAVHIGTALAIAAYYLNRIRLH